MALSRESPVVLPLLAPALRALGLLGLLGLAWVRSRTLNLATVTSRWIVVPALRPELASAQGMAVI